MATRSKVLLLLLVGISAIMRVDEVSGVSNNVAELQRERWAEKLPAVGIPETVVIRLSPLSLTQLQNSAAGLKKMDATSFDAQEFCQSAGLICREDTPSLKQLPSSFVNPKEKAGEVEENIFFDKKELRESGEMILPDLSPSKYLISFLPSELAEMMPPFTTANVSQIMKLLNVPSESNMSRNMLSTLEMCEERVEEGEVKRCSTSIEAMVEFVVSLLGSDVDLISDPSVVGSGQRVTVTKASKRQNIKPPVTCHNFVFPYGVSYCHSINGSEVYDLRLEVVQDNEKVTRNATAVCHYLSDGAGGKQAACHGVYGEMLVWTPKPKRH